MADGPSRVEIFQPKRQDARSCGGLCCLSIRLAKSEGEETRRRPECKALGMRKLAAGLAERIPKELDVSLMRQEWQSSSFGPSRPHGQRKEARQREVPQWPNER